MFPNDQWSDSPVSGTLRSPHYEGRDNPLLAQDIGPSAVQDASSGLEYQNWTAEYTAGSVWLYPSGTPSSAVELFRRSSIDFLSLSWDYNARPVVAFEDGGRVLIWWYDPVLQAETTTDLCDGAEPLCHLDDRRPQASRVNDVLLIYRRDDTAYYRRQRDRYGIELDTPLVGVTDLHLIAWAWCLDTLRMQVVYSGAAA